MNLLEYMKKYSRFVEDNLNLLFIDNNKIPIIEEAMKYSLLGGGKRLRPLLMFMTCDLFDGSLEEVVPFACSLEMIHTYSLIHDDLPAMDNDDYRRGKPSNHKVFGEGFAILAGDALLNSAYELLFRSIMDKPSQSRIESAFLISQAAGIKGMIGGQAMDLHYENKNIDIDNLNKMHSKKTGALIQVALEVGAILSDAKKEDLERIREYGRNLGRAYQISDDILDVIGTKEKMGKTVGKDAKENKSTYITYYGLETSKNILLDTVNKAKRAIEIYGSKAHLLNELADFVAYRDS